MESAKRNFENFEAIFYSRIINAKLKDGENYLSFLIKSLTNENYDDVSEMIKLMLRVECNVNYQNSQLETPFYHLLVRLSRIPDKCDLLTFFIDNTNVDYHLHKSDEVIKMINAQGLAHKIVARGELKIDIESMTRQLDNNDESAFAKSFDEFRLSSKDYQLEVKKLLREAIARGLSRTVEFLMVNGANTLADDSRTTPGELACIFGHHEVLQVLLKDSGLVFKSKDSRSSLLHKILSAKDVNEIDRQKCFDLIITDHRCGLDVINEVDQNKQTPLSLACLNGFNKITKELLRRGAYIGHESIIANIDKDLFEDFLDECVICSNDVSEKNCEVNIDYRFLMPPKKKDSEMKSISLIAENDTLVDLILHPVVSTLLALKWQKISYLVYFNIIVHFGFLMVFGNFVVQRSRFDDLTNVTYKSYTLFIPENETSWNRENWVEPFSLDYFLFDWDFWISVIGIGLITLNELAQLILSFKKYVTKLSNYLDIIFVLYSLINLLFLHYELPISRESRSILILLVAAQCIQVITKVSTLPMSLHMTIFKRVCSTFLKTLSLYMILIVAFAMSFHSMYIDEKKDAALWKKFAPEDIYEEYSKKNEEFADRRHLTFENMLTSIIITVRMMVGDFEYFRFHRNDEFQEILFVAFVILISIVLFNLLNALTISDTNNILRVAELVEANKTVSILKSYEKLFVTLRWSFARIFPQTSSIKLTPNRSNSVLCEPKSKPFDEISIPIDTKVKKEKISSQKKFSSKLIQKIRNFLKLKHDKKRICSKCCRDEQTFQ